jgi:PAS domain S-box-containing protein
MRGLLFLLLGVATVPLIVLMAALHIVWYYGEMADEREANLELSHALALTFSGYVDDVSRQESVIGRALVALIPYTAEQANQYLTENAAEYMAVAGFCWTNPQGEVIASSNSGTIGLKIGDRPYFQEILRGTPLVVSNLLEERATGQLTFIIARGIRDTQGTLKGVVFAPVEPGELGRRVLNLRRLQRGMITIFDREGTLVVVLPEAKLTLEQRRWKDKDPLLAVALAGKDSTGSLVSPIGGNLRIGARVPVAGLGWVVGASRPATEVSGPLLRQLALNLAIIAGVVAVSAGLAFLISRRISRPVRDLRQAALAVGRGDLDRRVDVRGVAELVELGEAFNRMAAGLKAAREDREKAQAALQEANAHLEQRVQERTEQLRLASLHTRSLIEASLDPLVTISPAGKVTDVNRATELATGLTRNQLIGTDFSDYFTEPARAREGYQKVIAEGEVRDYPLTLRHVSGRTIDVLYNATVYRNEAGDVQGVFAAARDVTDRKRMEEELRQASLYTRSLIEASLDPLVTISPEGKVTDVNRATELATGLTRNQLIGTDFSDYFTEPQRAREGYQKVIAEGEVRDYPLTLRHVSGRTMDVLYNATVYRNEAGEVQGVFAAARDITERKRTEQELEKYRQHLEELVGQRTAELETSNRQLQEEIAERKRVAEDLARSNKDLEQFAYVASHDLQEPLRIVSGYLQLIERRYKGKLAAEADEFINFAVDGAARMQSLIQDLLAYSRVGTQGRRFAPTDCENVFERAVGNLGRAVADSAATVTHDPLPTVLADATQLVQVFQNLIGNAIKFRGAEPPRIHVAARPQDGRWLFSVRDNGIGVEPQYAERIFVLFQRLHPRDKYPGTGIGLSVCQRIIERHGGRIWVESKPGEGSTFHFTLSQARSGNSGTGMGKL